MKILAIVFLLLITGCLTPQAQQNQALLGAALINYSAMRSMNAPQPYQMQVAPIPQLQQQRSGWITGPKGQTYYYMGN